jgi:hypothetical protein
VIHQVGRTRQAKSHRLVAGRSRFRDRTRNRRRASSVIVAVAVPTATKVGGPGCLGALGHPPSSPPADRSRSP